MSNSATAWTVAYQAPLSWDFPGKNTRVGCHAFFQRIFLTQGLNRVSMSPALVAGFFTINVTWEAPCTYPLHLLYPYICQWTFRLLPCLGYCAAMNTEVHVQFLIRVLSRYMSRNGIVNHMGTPCLVFGGTSLLTARRKMERYRYVPAGHSWPSQMWVMSGKLNKGTNFGNMVSLREIPNLNLVQHSGW